MPRKVGRNAAPGRALVSFVGRNPRIVVWTVVLLVGFATGGVAAAPFDPASTGSTATGP